MRAGSDCRRRYIADLLPRSNRRGRAFGKTIYQVFCTRGCRRRVVDEDAPEPVRSWARSLPPWVSVRDLPAALAVGLEKLHAGERAAISLAEFLGADLVLFDEKAARRVATDRGLRVTGILGVLSEAASLGLVDLAPAIDRLRTTNFRCSAALLKATLDRAVKQ